LFRISFGAVAPVGGDPKKRGFGSVATNARVANEAPSDNDVIEIGHMFFLSILFALSVASCAGSVFSV